MNAQKCFARRSPAALSLALLILAGCASPPTEPRVVALPGNQKSLDAFQTDDHACRDMAGQQFAGPSAPGRDMQWHFDSVYVQCMYSRGEKVPLIGGPETYRWDLY